MISHHEKEGEWRGGGIKEAWRERKEMVEAEDRWEEEEEEEGC